MYLGGGGNAFITNDLEINTDSSTNFVEINPGGIQVVSSDDRFVQIIRRKPGDTATKLFQLNDGHLEIASRAFIALPSTATYASDDSHAIFARGNILPSNPGDGSGVGVRPFALGKSGNAWNQIYADNLNGLDISGLVSQLASGPVTSTGTTYQNTSSTDYDSRVILPGGLILQFGYTYDNSPTGRRRLIEFGTAFPNALLSAGCSTVRDDRGGDGYNHVYNLSKSRMWIVIDGDRGFWWAYGK